MRVGIIGGAGYTAGELIRLLLNHPDAEIAYVHSSSNAGRMLYEVHEGLYGETDMRFSTSYSLTDIDLLFLCQGHGASRQFWSENVMPDSLKVIDLAQDFRDESDGYVYGLPELQREKICTSQKVANPGCFATAIQLALMPIALAGIIKGEVHVTAITGSTGAGVKPSATTHFSWRNDNLSVYKAFEHQHLGEINRTLCRLANKEVVVNFIPVRGDFARGIFAMSYIDTLLSEDEVRAVYKDFYKDARFTYVSDQPIDMKQVINTNKALISIEKHGDKLLIISAIDNLLKGASGQAVQNMNLMFGLAEDAGLKLKSSAF